MRWRFFLLSSSCFSSSLHVHSSFEKKEEKQDRAHGYSFEIVCCVWNIKSPRIRPLRRVLYLCCSTSAHLQEAHVQTVGTIKHSWSASYGRLAARSFKYFVYELKTKRERERGEREREREREREINSTFDDR